jgi:hypothetical protein
MSHKSATAAFVVDLSNGRRTADVDLPYGGGVVVTPAILFGDFYNALDSCDSHWRNGAAARSKLPVVRPGVSSKAFATAAGSDALARGS